MKKARDLLIKIFDHLMQPEMRILPGQLAFFLVLSIIPLAALLVTIAAALSISTESIRVAMETSMPKQIADLLNSIIANGGINFNIIVFYFSAFLLASNGTYSMINTSNEIYKVTPKNYFSRRLKAIVMIFILMGLFLFLLAVPVFGSTISEIIVNITGSTDLVILTSKILSILKYPLILLILFLNIKMMYVIAPDEEIPSKTTNKGALFTTILWVFATEIYAFYVGKFASYDVFYGSVSNILVLLLWVYLLSYIFVFGMVINVSSYKED